MRYTPAVLLGYRFSVWHILFNSWIDYYLFGNQVTGEFPSELILPADLGIIIRGIDNFVVVILVLAVIVGDGLRDCRHING